MRQKVERMFKAGKTVEAIAAYFSLPEDIIEEMVCSPPVKQLKGFPGKDGKAKVRGAQHANSGYFV